VDLDLAIDLLQHRYQRNQRVAKQEDPAAEEEER
jgi:hypothetical protein